MRLGKDAIVFTKNGGALSVGLFSQTYLEGVHAEEVVIPLVPFSQQNSILPPSGWAAALIRRGTGGAAALP